MPDEKTPEEKPKRFRDRKKDEWNIIDGDFSGLTRPEPPEQLTPTQAEIWRKIVSSEPVDFFGSQTTRDMLKDLVCHRDAINSLSDTINMFKKEWIRTQAGAKMYERYLKMRSDETKAFSLVATRLRLTNQSRYTPQHAATTGRNTAKVRPWEDAAEE